MTIQPIKKAQKTTQDKPKNEGFVPMGEWIVAIAANAYVRKHLMENPDKIQFGFDDSNNLCIMINK